MTKDDLEGKLNAVLGRLGVDSSSFSSIISAFRQKLEILRASGRFNKLLKSLLSSNQPEEFNSYVFEALFAYDFESNGEKLIYEISQLPQSSTSIDFCYEPIDQITIYLELRLITQRQWITQSMDLQLHMSGVYEISLKPQQEQAETLRLQNIILDKCLDNHGMPRKFRKSSNGSFNFIVVNVSDLHLTMMDRDDCLLALYGDPAVQMFNQRGIFGMWQELPNNPSDEEKTYHEKFEYFRNIIHAVLFIRYVKGSGHLNKLYIDRELEYFLVGNRNLLKQNELESIANKLSIFLRKWPKQ